MADIISTLTKIANRLDSKDLVAAADRVDKATRYLAHFKVAEQEGFYGYWVRNSRCFTNCYRVKRGKNPGKSAQEVWMSCWDEYRDYLNGHYPHWDKYASKSAENVRVASAAKGRPWDLRFAAEVEKAILFGVQPGEAIQSNLQKLTDEKADQVTACAHALIKSAAEAKDVDGEAAERLAQMASHLLKTAQFQWFQNWRERNKTRGDDSRFQNLRSTIDAKIRNHVNMYGKNWNSPESLSGLQQEVHNWAMGMSNRFNNPALKGAILQLAMPQAIAARAKQISKGYGNSDMGTGGGMASSMGSPQMANMATDNGGSGMSTGGSAGLLNTLMQMATRPDGRLSPKKFRSLLQNLQNKADRYIQEYESRQSAAKASRGRGTAATPTGLPQGGAAAGPEEGGEGGGEGGEGGSPVVAPGGPAGPAPAGAAAAPTPPGVGAAPGRRDQMGLPPANPAGPGNRIQPLVPPQTAKQNYKMNGGKAPVKSGRRDK